MSVARPGFGVSKDRNSAPLLGITAGRYVDRRRAFRSSRAAHPPRDISRDLCALQSAHHLFLATSPADPEIAWQLGYIDAPSFSNAFKVWTGLTPTEWRQIRPGTEVSLDATLQLAGDLPEQVTPRHFAG
jgi:AraC-like DNA-binding protein